SRRRHTRSKRDWSSDVCSSDLGPSPTTGLSRQRRTPATHPVDQVLHLGQGYLRLTLAGLRVLREDIENEHRAVDDLRVQRVLQGDHLSVAQLAIANHGIRTGGL